MKKPLTDYQLQCYDIWIQKVQAWATRHGITVDSAVSIISDDSKFNPETEEDDLISIKDLWSPHLSHLCQHRRDQRTKLEHHYKKLAAEVIRYAAIESGVPEKYLRGEPGSDEQSAPNDASSK